MLKYNFYISIIIFSIMLSVTSLIKNKTRLIEKEIYKINKKISLDKRDLNETQLDFFYLSSPEYLSKKILDIGIIEYKPMEFSKIYLSIENFNENKNKLSKLKNK